MALSKRGLPLQWVIVMVIMAITLLLSVTLITRAYMDQRDLLLEAAESSSKQLAGRLDSASLSLLAPVTNSLQLLVHDTLLEAQTLDQRLERLPMLIQVLRSNPVTSAVYAGYPDKDFVLVRDLRLPALQQRVNAPAQTAWMVQSIDHRDDGQVERFWLFYTDQMALLEMRPMPEYTFDPTQRPWYKLALGKTEPTLTPPYLFFTTQEVGVTLSRQADSGAIAGIDASVQEISYELAELKPEGANRLAVVDSTGTVIAWPEVDEMLIANGNSMRLATLGELGVPALEKLRAVAKKDGRMVRFDEQGTSWFGLRRPLLSLQGASLELLLVVPASELLQGIRDRRLAYVYWALAITFVAFLAGCWMSYRLTRPLDRLSQWVMELARFDFSRQGIKHSGVREVNQLNEVLGSMANAIRHFQSISHTLARERQLERMLPLVAEHLKASIDAEESAIYLLDSETATLKLASGRERDATKLPRSLMADSCKAKVLRAKLEDSLPEGKGHWLISALQGREAEISGFMVLRITEDDPKMQTSLSNFVDELSGSAATAIETRQLIEAQQRLLDAIVHLLADAIDAKSPHTSGHCERVPELAQMLVDVACKSSEGEFAKFQMSESQRYEFHLAAWMHDCGKITTPEHVLDKSVKLDALYNRIHEIRTRFEVLWRDTEINYLKGVLEQQNEQVLHERMLAERERLQAEFALVAQLNLGTESLDDADIEALERIAARTWERHFDKRMGLSDIELERMPEEGELPITERLLADKPEHLIPWGDRRPPVEAGNPDNIWGFDMELPEHQDNQGEMYNLTQRYGTLTPEERFSINNHIVQTIRMLSSLPLPKHLRRMPDIAGNHHERVDGKGYPRKLLAAELSIPERIMALADVFEALTAADRPYKKAKTLSESLRILAFMARDGHLDPAIFKLFLDSEIYLDYARRYLSDEQIDKVDARQLWLLAKGEG